MIVLAVGIQLVHVLWMLLLMSRTVTVCCHDKVTHVHTGIVLEVIVVFFGVFGNAGWVEPYRR